MLHLDDLQGGLANKGFHHHLVGDEVRAFDGVEGVGLEAVLGVEHGRRAAFGGNAVAAHGIDLRDQADRQTGAQLSRRDRRPQAGKSASYDQDVVGRRIHPIGNAIEALDSSSTPVWHAPAPLPKRCGTLVVGGGITGAALLHWLRRRWSIR